MENKRYYVGVRLSWDNKKGWIGYYMGKGYGGSAWINGGSGDIFQRSKSDFISFSEEAAQAQLKHCQALDPKSIYFLEEVI